MIFIYLIVLRSSKENSPREIQDEGTTMVRNVGNCSTTDTVSRPKEPHAYSHCMALFLVLIMIFWFPICSPLRKFRCTGSTTVVFVVLCVTDTMTTYKYSKV